MPATQISFSDFALSQCPWCGATGPDFADSPMPSDYCGHDPATVCTPSDIAAHASASVVTHGGDFAGECIPRLRVRYRVDVCYPGSPVQSFLWPTAARANACAQDFPRGHAVIHMVTGHQTLFGFVESCPQ